MQLCSLCLLLMCWGHWRRGGVFILDNASGGAGALGETAQGLTLEAGSQQTALNLLGVGLKGGSSSGGGGGEVDGSLSWRKPEVRTQAVLGVEV